MQIKIKDKEFELNFGVKFVRLLDEHMPIKVNINGMGEQPLSMALNRALPALQTYDTAMLSDIIYYALWKTTPRPSKEDVDDFLDDPKTNIEKLFKDVQAEMKKANAIKMALKNLKA